MSGRRATHVHFACFAATVATAACGAARPSFVRTEEGAAYSDGRISFTVPHVPARWRAVDVTHATLGFRDDAARASILLNARCGPLDHDTPLVALTNHLLIGTTEREISSQEVEPFDGREALHTEALAKLDGVLLSFDLFVLKKDGCVYDFARVTPARTEADPGTAAFRSFVRGFHTGAAPRPAGLAGAP
jgi:hypothetical protein